MGLLRLVLALSVVLGHGAGYAELIFVNGNAAVFCFFIISGFYMALLLDTAYAGRPLSFYINRALRLYPAYLFVLLITIIYREFKAGDISYFFNSGIEQKVWAVISNVLFIGMDYLRKHAVSEFGYPTDWRIVPQAWTLDVEIMFYLVAPIFLALPTKRPLIKLGSFFLMALLVWSYDIELSEFILWMTLPKYLIFFACGAISYLLYGYIKSGSYLKERHYLYIAVVLGVAIVSFAYIFKVQEDYFKAQNDQFLGIRNVSLYFAIAIWLPFLFLATRNFKFDRYIGELSYPIYLVHLFVIKVMSDYGLLVFRWKSTISILFIVIIISMVIHHCIEIPVERLRVRIRG